MNDILLRSSWVLTLRGVLALLFGILVLVLPGLTLISLVVLFVAYSFLGGMVAIAGALAGRKKDDDWWLLLLLGVVGIVASVVAFAHPALSALILLLMIGANALITGILDIITAVRLRKVRQHEGLLILSGLSAIAFGIVVFLFPEAGALTLAWLISLYALVSGLLMVSSAFHIRTWMKKPGIATESDRRISDRRVLRHS